MYIVLEGVDHSGKTTQIKLLEKVLLEKGHDVFIKTEPSKDLTGKLIREYLGAENPFNTQSRYDEFVGLLYLADRFHNYFNKETGINKLENENKIILSDRNFYSSLIYNFSDPMYFNRLEYLNDYMFSHFPIPNITFLLDINIDTYIERSNKEDKKENYDLDLKGAEQRIYKYRDILETKAIRIDANKSIEEVHEEIINALNAIDYYKF